MVFSGYSGFLHQLYWSPRYNWNIVESGVKHHNPNPKLLYPQTIPAKFCLIIITYIRIYFILIYNLSQSSLLEKNWILKGLYHYRILSGMKKVIYMIIKDKNINLLVFIWVCESFLCLLSCPAILLLFLRLLQWQVAVLSPFTTSVVSTPGRHFCNLGSFLVGSCTHWYF